MAYKLIDRYIGALTAELTSSGTTMTVDTPLVVPAGAEVIVTLEDDRSAPTVYEEVIVDGYSGLDISISTRGHAGTQQAWPIGTHVSVYVQSETINAKVDNSGDDFTVRGVSAEYYDNGASGTVDRANGEAQSITLTTAGTAITVTGLSATQRYLLLELYDADTYAPDISALTPWIGDAPSTFGAMSRILAEYCADGTVRFTDLGNSAS